MAQEKSRPSTKTDEFAVRSMVWPISSQIEANALATTVPVTGSRFRALMTRPAS